MNKLALPKELAFEWDVHNSDKNRLKHQVAVLECEQVFFDQPIYLVDEKHSQTETRFHVLGMTNNLRLLFIVFTIRKHKIRVISARNQNKKEKINYQKHSL